MHSVRPDEVSAADFRAAMGAFATGVTVVTVGTRDGGRYGMTVNAFSSVSLDPALVLICLAATGHGQEMVRTAGVFGISVLADDQEELSRWFADRRRPQDAAMFDGLAVALGATGCPVLLGAAASFDCRVEQLVTAGDHLIVIGEVVGLRRDPERGPLVFHGGGYQVLDADRSRAQLRAV